MKIKVKFKSIEGEALEIYNTFHMKEGSEFIATPVTIQALIDISKKTSIKNVLEMGSGIGTISYTLLKYTDAHIDLYEDNEYCQNALKKNLEQFEGRYTLLPNYKIHPPRKRYDLFIVDGGNGKRHDGGAIDAIDSLLNFIDDISIVYVEGHRYTQRARLRKILSRRYIYSLVEYDSVLVDNGEFKGELTVYCKKSNNSYAKKINYIYWSILEPKFFKNAFLFKIKNVKVMLINAVKTIFRSSGFILGKFIKKISSDNKKQIYIFCAYLNKITDSWLYVLSYDFTMALANSSHHSSDKEMLVSKFINQKVDISLDISKRTQRQIFISKIYEPHITNYLKDHLKNSDIFIDVGANVGYYTLLASDILSNSGEVLSFEPEPENLNCLRKNTSTRKNVRVFGIALAAESGEGLLYLNPENEGGHSMKHNFSNFCGSKEFSQYIVQKSKLDDLFFSSKYTNKKNIIIKIDVEGYELDVLTGMEQLLSSNKEIEILCEVSENKKEIFNLLQNKGFTPYLLDHGGNPITTKMGENRKRDYLFKRQQH